MRKLFICFSGINRSPTAANMFGGRYCGLYEYDGRTINKKLPVLIEWAETIFVMEEYMKDEVEELTEKKVVNLGILDVYSRGEPRLKEILIKKMINYAVFNKD